jgi:hypothetical protein
LKQGAHEEIRENFIERGSVKKSRRISWASFVAGAYRMGRAKGRCCCFPRVASFINVDMDTCCKRPLETHGAYVGGGHWLKNAETHFRVGYM